MQRTLLQDRSCPRLRLERTNSRWLSLPAPARSRRVSSSLPPTDRRRSAGQLTTARSAFSLHTDFHATRRKTGRGGEEVGKSSTSRRSSRVGHRRSSWRGSVSSSQVVTSHRGRQRARSVTRCTIVAVPRSHPTHEMDRAADPDRARRGPVVWSSGRDLATPHLAVTGLWRRAFKFSHRT